MKRYNTAVVGATGVVGRTFIKILEEYNFPTDKIGFFASERSEGEQLEFRGEKITVRKAEADCFKGYDLALFSAGGSVSGLLAPEAAARGATVIDNSSHFRMDKNVPLLVPEINMDDYHGEKIIANPNCSTIQSVIPLNALMLNFGLESVSFTTFQAVSGSGMKGIKDLENTKKGCPPSFYPHDISNTCIPEIDVADEGGYTKEELKMVNETRKILGDENLKISATCVRVPVPNSHAVCISAQLKSKFELKDVVRALSEQKGIAIRNDLSEHCYPVSTEANGTDLVYVGRIRRDTSCENGVLLYCVADNIRKGAASNAVQIAKALAECDKL